MADIHALDKHCRVCGGTLKRGKHPCSEQQEALLATFGLDISTDSPDVHPQRFFHRCYATYSSIQGSSLQSLSEGFLLDETW